MKRILLPLIALQIFLSCRSAKPAEVPATEPAPISAPEPAPDGGEEPAGVTDAEPEPIPPIPVASRNQPVPQPEPYRPVYLLDYMELAAEDERTAESAFNPNAGRYQYIENPDARDDGGRTLLMKAARDANTGLMESLIYSEADVNAADGDGWTALMFAARFSNSTKAVAMLLDAGARPQARNDYGITALLLATEFAEDEGVISLLLEKRSAAEKEVLAAFVCAVTREAPPAVLRLFTDKGVAVNAPYDGKTPLMHAAETNASTATLRWLLEHGARTRYRTAAGQTAFDFARANRRLPRDEVYWSLNGGADR